MMKMKMTIYERLAEMVAALERKAPVVTDAFPDKKLVFAWQRLSRDSLRVAVATCSKHDKFVATYGEILAIERLYDGEVFTARIPEGETPDEVIATLAEVL